MFCLEKKFPFFALAYKKINFRHFYLSTNIDRKNHGTRNINISKPSAILIVKDKDLTL